MQLINSGADVNSGSQDPESVLSVFIIIPDNVINFTVMLGEVNNLLHSDLGSILA